MRPSRPEDRGTRGNPMTITTVTSENAAEFYAQRLQLENPPADDSTEASADGAGEGKKDGSNTETKDSQHQTRKPKPIQPRINELVGERNAARTEAEAKAAEAEAARIEAQELRDRLEAAERQIAALSTSSQKEADPRPTRDKFASDEQYLDALTDWKVDQRIAADKRREAEARHAAAQAEVTRNWQAQIEAGKDDMPDFDAVVGAAEINFSQVVLDAIVDVGPRVAYHLAKNPAEARRIAAMRPVQAIAAVTKLGEQLTTAAAASPAPSPAPTPAAKGETKTFKAPEPIDPLKGTSTPAVRDLDDIEDYEEWKAAYNAGRR